MPVLVALVALFNLFVEVDDGQLCLLARVVDVWVVDVMCHAESEAEPVFLLVQNLSHVLLFPNPEFKLEVNLNLGDPVCANNETDQVNGHHGQTAGAREEFRCQILG